MSDNRPFGRILLLKHHRKPSDALLAGAVELARRARASLTFAHALEGGDRIDQGSQSERLRELETMLAPHLDGLAVQYRLVTGDPTRAAQQAAGRYDLIIPTEGRAHGEAAERELVRLLRHSPVPLWLDGDSGRPPRGILAAVDLQSRNPVKQALNLPIVRRAAHLATLFDAQLDLLSVCERPPAADLLAHRLAGESEPAMPTRRRSRELLQALLAEATRTGSAPPGEPRLMVAQGRADRLIRQAADSASVDVLVAGCVGRTGLAGWLVGNTAERLTRELDCSILAITPARDTIEEIDAERRSRAA